MITSILIRALGLWVVAAAILLQGPAGLPAAETLSDAELALVRAAERARIETVEKVYGAVVAVYGAKPGAGGGSGVIYDPAGYALTNFHVVQGAMNGGKAGLADGRLYDWKLVGVDPGGDVAIIKLAGRDRFPHAALGNSDRVRPGDFVMAMGNPFLLAEDQRPTVTLGIVSGVRRYQHGQANNLLVYGNCIQVDSSINPGNSGGPLFNMDGEVIGINGRGSFKERGRVNVGVGYAISIEQIKTFIPDLLATKTVMHGTLDAVFTNRTGGVICSQINLDSRAADLGLELGDRLVSFDGHAIDDANQFTNLISTLPAGWPVQLVYERQGERRSMWLRLTPLPYGSMASDRRPPRPRPGPDEEKVEDVKAPKAKPGEIRDRAINRREADRVFAAWTVRAGGREAIDRAGAFEFTDRVLLEGKQIGDKLTTIAADGRFRIQANIEGAKMVYAFDGKTVWRQEPGSPAETLSMELALDDPLVVEALALATMLRAEGLKSLDRYELQGGGEALGRRAYRLRATRQIDGKDRFDMIWWLSLLGDDGAFQTELLKASLADAGDPDDLAVTFADYREVAGVRLPHRRRLVSGLAEKVKREFVTSSLAAAKVDDALFQPPEESKKSATDKQEPTSKGSL